MAKSQMFKPPLQFIYTHGGVFPVRRARDEEAFKTAHAILARGDLMVMYAEAGAAQRRARQAPARGRQAGARVGGPGGADGHRRQREGAQLEAPAVPQGHGAVRRAASLRAGGAAHSRPGAGSVGDHLRSGARHARVSQRGPASREGGVLGAPGGRGSWPPAGALLVARPRVRHCSMSWPRDDQRVRYRARRAGSRAASDGTGARRPSRRRLRTAQRPQRVERVARHEHLAAAQAQDDRQMPRGMAWRVDEPHAPVAEQVERAPEGRKRVGLGASKSSVRQSKAWSNWRGK